MSDIRADTIDDVVFGLQVWKLSIDSICVRENVYNSLEPTFAAISLANLTLSLETSALAVVSKDLWPSDLENRLGFIKSDLAKAELALKKLLGLLEGLKDQKIYTLKAKIERLLE